jgi:hypothetical protein
MNSLEVRIQQGCLRDQLFLQGILPPSDLEKRGGGGRSQLTWAVTQRQKCLLWLRYAVLKARLFLLRVNPTEIYSILHLVYFVNFPTQLHFPFVVYCASKAWLKGQSSLRCFCFKIFTKLLI